jgi:hypothetical protein
VDENMPMPVYTINFVRTEPVSLFIVCLHCLLLVLLTFGIVVLLASFAARTVTIGCDGIEGISAGTVALDRAHAEAALLVGGGGRALAVFVVCVLSVAGATEGELAE